jgi:hypothetical protein
MFTCSTIPSSRLAGLEGTREWLHVAQVMPKEAPSHQVEMIENAAEAANRMTYL